MRKLLRLSLITACLLCPVGVLEAGPIVNGSFESPGLAAGTWTTAWFIPGWTATGQPLEIGWGSVYGISGYDLNQVLELDSYGNYVAAQLVTSSGRRVPPVIPLRDERRNSPRDQHVRGLLERRIGGEYQSNKHRDVELLCDRHRDRG